MTMTTPIWVATFVVVSVAIYLFLLWKHGRRIARSEASSLASSPASEPAFKLTSRLPYEIRTITRHHPNSPPTKISGDVLVLGRKEFTSELMPLYKSIADSIRDGILPTSVRSVRLVVQGDIAKKFELEGEEIYCEKCYATIGFLVPDGLTRDYHHQKWCSEYDPKHETLSERLLREQKEAVDLQLQKKAVELQQKSADELATNMRRSREIAARSVRR